MPGIIDVDGKTDGGVQSGTSVGSAKADAGDKGDTNSPAAKIAFLGGGELGVLNHQDDQNEEESASNFGGESSEHASSRGRENGNSGRFVNSVLNVVTNQAAGGEEHAEEGTGELGSCRDEEANNVLATVLVVGNEDTKGDSGVVVTTSDVSEKKNAAEKGHADTENTESKDGLGANGEDEHASAEHFTKEEVTGMFVSLRDLHESR